MSCVNRPGYLVNVYFLVFTLKIKYFEKGSRYHVATRGQAEGQCMVLINKTIKWKYICVFNKVNALWLVNN